MTRVAPGRRAAIAWTLLVARAVYAYNWYDVGGVLPLIGAHFDVGTVQRGIVLASFLAGAAAFQLPAGMVAMRWGARSTAISALAAMGLFALASAAAPNWIVLALLRFGAGAGAAFFFAPALGLVTSFYRAGERGLMIGAYNAAFSVGAGVGLFASAYLGPSAGWPLTLALGGALLLGVAVVSIPFVPSVPEERRLPRRELLAAARPAIRSRPLWALAIGGAGLWGGYYIAAQYFVDFAHSAHPAWSLAVAAAAPTVMIALEVPGGPIGGWFGERSRDLRRPLILWGLASAVLIAVVPYLGLVPGVIAFVPLGFADGVTFALLYLLPTYFSELRGSVFAFALAFENFVQILLGAGLAVVFALIASAAGYGWAWLFAGASTAAFLPALIWATPTTGTRDEGSASQPLPSP